MAGTDAPAPPRPRRLEGACATLIESEEPDALRVIGPDARTVLYASAQVGLAIVDASAPDDPVVVATSAFTGAPVGVFGWDDDHAVAVFAPWDGPALAVVRSVELKGRAAGRTAAEVVLHGAPRDARRVGDVLVVTRDVPGEAAVTAVTAFLPEGTGLDRRAELRLPGRGAIVGSSPSGLAVARPAEPELGADRTAVTWIGVTQEGALDLHGTAIVAGVVPAWRRASDHLLDVDEDGRVRVVACSTAACPGGESATFSAIDFAAPDRPRVTGSTVIARAGDGVFRFAGDRLVVARAPARHDGTTEIAVLRATAELAPAGSVEVRGAVGSLAVRDDDIFAAGWTGSASAGKRAIVHRIDLRRAPRHAGSISFGGDWTWSPAYDDARALSFDPASMLAALPMTTLRGPSAPVAAVQILGLGAGAPRDVAEREVGAVDRLLFVDGRLLAFSADGVDVVRLPGERPRHRTWDDVPSLVR